MKLDHSVYPDLDRPPLADSELDTPEAKADYVQRICSQWDYGILPSQESFTLFARWREIFDRFPLSHSAAYHTFRFLFGWNPLPGRALRAGYQIDDMKEGRTDPCERWI